MLSADRKRIKELEAERAELLRALEIVFSEIGTVCGEDSREAASLGRIEDMLRAAIRKAKGEPAGGAS